MNIISFLDGLGGLFFLVAFFLALSLNKNSFDKITKIILCTTLGIYIFVAISNLLEHAGITSFLDHYEDYAEIVFVPLFLLFLSSFQVNREFKNRQHTEKLLREQSDLLQSIFRSAPVGIGLVANRVFQWTNLQISAITGYSNDDLKGKSSRIMYESDDAFNLVGKDKYGQIKANNTGSVETQWLRKDGKLIDVLLSSTPLDPADLSVGVVFTLLDITAQKETKRELQASEQKYRGIFNAPGEAIFIHDAATGLILDVNQAMLDIYGYSYKEALLLDVEAISSGEPPYTQQEAMIKNKNAAMGELQLFEWQCRKKSGEIFWADVALKFIEVRDEKFVIAVIRNIDSRKQAEDSLRKASSEWFTAMNASEDAIYLLDLNRHILRGNKAFYHMTGTNSQIAIGRHIEDIVHPNGKIRSCPVCLAQEEKQDAIIILEPDNPDNFTDRPIEITIKIVRDDAGEPLSILMNRHDLTRQREIENELRRNRDHLEDLVNNRTQELKLTHKQLLHAGKLSAIGSLSASIAHEFNNPLQGVMNIIKGVARRATLEEDDAELMAMAVSECNRMGDLIKSLQDFNRPTSGKKEAVDIHAILDNLLVLGKKDCAIRKISIEKKYSESLPLIRAVADQIKQVLLNILNNACDACDQGGTITITTEDQVEKVLVHIEDTGSGIKAEDKNHIFDPFFTTKPSMKGTGLGLSVSYGIIKNHGGDIVFKSELEQGTRFSIILPIEGGDSAEK